jgi:ABC-type Fe3+-hydroxamate transport system substrate-binding protein
VRVVSLLPSVTETLRAWGRDPVACTRFCEQPDLPHVGGTKDPDLDAIAALRPDLVVVDEEENRREDAVALADRGIALFVTAVRSVADVAPTLERLAATLAFAREPAPEGPIVPTSEQGMVGFVPIWRKPWMTINGDTYGSSLLESIGVSNVFADHPDRYPTVVLEADVVPRRPDRVLAPSEPYPFGERQRAELEVVAPVTFVDGQDLFWWGVRTPVAAGRLAAALGLDYLDRRPG